jgi:hypothetical protein
LQREKVFQRLRVHGVAVGIRARGQIDFRAVDVEEAVRLAGRQRRSLGRIHDVVRHAGDFRRLGAWRNKTLKGMNAHGGNENGTQRVAHGTHG